MGKKVIVTEKPSVARSYAKALGVESERHDGYLEDDRYIITWCIGHLVSLAYPEAYNPELKQWSMDTLPFLPKDYIYRIVDEVAPQFRVIKRIYNRSL